jgi:hypothetical protein
MHSTSGNRYINRAHKNDNNMVMVIGLYKTTQKTQTLHVQEKIKNYVFKQMSE